MTVPALKEILVDSKTSAYLDDAYYDLLRADLVDWKARGVPLTERERATYEGVVLQENWLLDQRDFEAWYGLFSRQCVYWAPANLDMPDPVKGDPRNQMAQFLDDRRRMADRVVWLRTNVAASQLPVSRTLHVSAGFVRVPSERAGEVKVRSQFIMHELRAHHPIQMLTGWMGHVFIEEEGVTKIDRKLICMVDANRARPNPTFLI